ncbi:cell growth regulator with EF hand domain protein 1 [Mixophyes fleayi]|uniref:cell growth regulator with EF hand domain protein 1 n=1 Tax=Mixophyes fleayi TaxID=3061075 RepID=UPI003F4E4273
MSALILLHLLPLLVSPGLAAPRTGSRSEPSEGGRILNPFALGADNLSLLQGYLKDKDPLEENAADMKREKVILHLFVLYDFDKNGLLDGLELMRLLSGILTKSLQEEPAQKSVVSLVDEVLDKQDLNLDGLLSVQELVTPPVYTEEDTLSVHVAIPPPAAHTDLPVALDNDPNKEIITEVETSDQPAEDVLLNQIQINDPASHPAEGIVIQDEPEDVSEEKVIEVEGVLVPEEEEE